MHCRANTQEKGSGVFELVRMIKCRILSRACAPRDLGLSNESSVLGEAAGMSLELPEPSIKRARLAMQ